MALTAPPLDADPYPVRHSRLRLNSVRRSKHDRAVYSYCITPGCAWTDDGIGYPHSQGEAHVLEEGHTVRVMSGREMLMRPAGNGGKR